MIDRTSGVLNAPDWAAYVRNEVTKEAKLGIGLSAVVTENEEGDSIAWADFSFRVLKMDENRIVRILVKRI